MLQTIVNAWKIADLRKKMIFTALIVLIFRIGSAIPVPFTNIGEAGIIADPNAGTFMNYLSMMTGDAFNYGTIFAMSITPYINSSIIMQLLAVAIPALERLQKEGEEGRKKIASITRFVTIALGVLQSTAYYFYLRSQGYLVKDASGANFTGFYGVFQALVIILCFTAGTALIMWLGERINEKGIGNGISIILFAGIVSRIPTLIATLFGESGYFQRGGPYYFLSPFVAVILILMIAFIVWMDNAERRVPVQYAKRELSAERCTAVRTLIFPSRLICQALCPLSLLRQFFHCLPQSRCLLSQRLRKTASGINSSEFSHRLIGFTELSISY